MKFYLFSYFCGILVDNIMDFDSVLGFGLLTVEGNELIDFSFCEEMRHY